MKQKLVSLLRQDFTLLAPQSVRPARAIHTSASMKTKRCKSWELKGVDGLSLLGVHLHRFKGTRWEGANSCWKFGEEVSGVKGIGAEGV